MTDWMLDFETLDTKPSAMVLSMGLVQFDRLTGKTNLQFFKKFDIHSGMNAERSQSEDTQKWWSEQSQSSKDAAFGGEALLSEMLTLFDANIGHHDKIWGNGATFDISIAEDIYRQLGREPAWKFWNVRDVRTVKDLAHGFVSVGTRPEDAHNPIADCKYQISYLCEMIKHLRGQ